MAFPQVVARTETPVTTATDPTINFTQTTGDLVVVFLSLATAQTITVSDSFTNLTNTNATFHVIYKILTGSEGGTVDITLATNSKAAAVAYNIQNFNSLLAPQLSTVATATSTGPDATTCTPTGGAKDYLWITAFGQAGEEADDDTWVTGTPTNFSNLVQTTSGTAGTAGTNTQTASAERTVNASSLDAAAFTTAQSLVWRAYTLAVHPVFVSHAQAQADIKQTYTDKSGQSNADIKQIYTDKSGQTQADIKAIGRGFGQAQGYLPDNARAAVGQAQAVDGVTDNLYTAIDELNPDDTDYVVPYLPLGTYTARFGLSAGFSPDFLINFVIRVRALGTLPSSTLQVKLYEGATLRASFSPTLTGSFATYEYTLTGPEMASISDYTILALEFVTNDRVLVSWAQMSIPSGAFKVSGQAQAEIKQTYTDKTGQAQADIKQTYLGLGQCQADIKQTYTQTGQAQGQIINIYNVHGQAQAGIKATSTQYGQAQADIKAIGYGLGQCQAEIKQTYNVHGQCQAQIINTYFGSGQCQADIKATSNGHGQCQADIKQTNRSHGQCQAQIVNYKYAHGQCQAKISGTFTAAYGQAQATIIAQYIHFLDTFTRTASNVNTTQELNYPDYGIYSGNSSVASDGDTASIDGSKIVIPYRDFFSTGYFANIPVDIVGPSTLSMEFKLTDYVSIDDFYFEVSIGQPGVTDGFIGMWTDAGEIFLYGGTSFASAPFVPGNGFKYRFLLYADHTEARAKWWLVDDGVNTYPEPSDWNLTISPDVPFVGQEAFFVSQVFGALGETMEVDNVSVYAPEPPAWLAFAQAQASIITLTRYARGQALARIKQTTNKHGQARVFIRKSAGYGQAQATINKSSQRSGQAQALIWRYQGYGQAQALIFTTTPNGQANAYIQNVVYPFGQAQGYVQDRHWPKGQAQTRIIRFAEWAFGQAQADIERKQGYGQSQGYIRFVAGFGQAQALIDVKRESGQAQGMIKAVGRAFGQARAYIFAEYGWGQAQGQIQRAYHAGYGQSQGYINPRYVACGNAQALITKKAGYGQANARIKGFGQWAFGNAQAFIRRRDTYPACGQSMGYIRRRDPVGQAAAMIGGGRYLVNYNGYQLPGYAQTETFPSDMRIDEANPQFEDGPFDEYTGLENKVLSLTMKVVGNDYHDVKNQVQDAGTILRSSKNWTRLYIQRQDRYYTVLTSAINTDKTVGTSMRTLDYSVEWEAKPWLTSVAEYEISGTTTITTDSVGRNIYNGGWTPARVIISGTNVTISGYIENGDAAGYVSISGAVTGLIINSEEYTATMAGENANEFMYTPNYQLFIGPGKTTFEITGASSVVIRWNDRWYL